MKIVNQNENVESVLDDAEICALKETFGLGGRPTERQRATAIEIFNEIAEPEERRWIQCDCLGQDRRNYPLLVPVSPKDKTRKKQLRRLVGPGRIPHDEFCPFLRDESEQAEVINSFSRPSGNEHFSLHNAFADEQNVAGGVIDDDKVPVERRSSVVKYSRPTLGRLLAKLLLNAGLNIVPETGFIPGREAAGRAITNALAKQIIRINRNVTVADVLRYGPNNYGRLRDHFTGLGDWPTGRPFCLYLTSLDGQNMPLNLLTEQGREYQISEPIRAPGWRNTLTSMNYVTLATYGVPNPGAVPQLLRAYAQPTVEAFSWFPVDSRLEATTLIALRDCYRVLRSEGYSIEIEKPLFNMPSLAAPGDVCIPDFILNIKHRQKGQYKVVVETMGATSKNYRASKQRTHPLMEALGPLVKHNAYVIFSFTADQKVEREKARKREEDRFKQRILDVVRAYPTLLPAPDCEQL